MDINFKNKYVAFIDVLGFSAIVDSDDKEKLNTYYNVVESSFDLFDLTQRDIQKYVISDSIILIADDSAENFKTLLTAISTLQASLAYFDIWVRGGVSFGPVYTDDLKNIIVGKGYIQAYLLEHQAKYPRVIIDPRIIAKLKMNRKQFCTAMNAPIGPDNAKLIHDYNYGARQIDDEAIFVSYAHRILISAEKNDHRLRQLLGANILSVNQVIGNIRKNIYGPQQHYHKYVWLKKYFGEVIVELASYMGDGAFDRKKMDKYLTELGSL